MTTQPILVLDTASPVVSVAVGPPGRVLAEGTLELRRSSERLLRTVEEVLEEAGLALDKLAGVAAFQGPGSFTGLRIGLGTVLGFHQALDLPATAIPTLPILAAAAAMVEGAGERVCRDPVMAAVDAIRGDWYVQSFRTQGNVTAVSEAGLRAGASLSPPPDTSCLIGFGVSCLRQEAWWPESGVELLEPPPLAPVAVRVAARMPVDWDPARLTSPIYFRPPAVTLPAAPAAPAGT